MKRPLILALLLVATIGSKAQFGSTTLPIKDFPTLPEVDTAVQHFLDRSADYRSLPVDKQQWFYWTNYSRTNPRRFFDSIVQPILNTFPTLRSGNASSLKRDLYKAAPLPMVVPNMKLDVVASGFAKEMAEANGKPSHTSPSGSTFQSRMQAAAIQKCAGENVSWGAFNPVFMLVLLYLDEGVPDLGHRKTLLDPAFEEMAIGIGKYKDGKYIVVQDFACKQQ